MFTRRNVDMDEFDLVGQALFSKCNPDAGRVWETGEIMDFDFALLFVYLSVGR